MNEETPAVFNAKQERHPSREVNLLVDDERDLRAEQLPWEAARTMYRMAVADGADDETAWRNAAQGALKAGVCPHGDLAAEAGRLRELLHATRAHLGWIWRESTDPRARDRADQALTELKEAGIE